MSLDPGCAVRLLVATPDASGVLGGFGFPPREPNSVEGDVDNGIEGEGPVVLGWLGPSPNGGESGCSGPKR